MNCSIASRRVNAGGDSPIEFNLQQAKNEGKDNDTIGNQHWFCGDTAVCG